MGFTLTQNCNFSATSKLRSPEKEATDKLNHDHMKQLKLNPPITSGSNKQISSARAIASQFLFHAHAWGFAAADIDLLFANHGRYSKFWIDNRNPSGNSGEGKTRIAVEKAIEAIKADRAAATKSQRTIAQLTPQQINTMIGRGV